MSSPPTIKQTARTNEKRKYVQAFNTCNSQEKEYLIKELLNKLYKLEDRLEKLEKCSE